MVIHVDTPAYSVTLTRLVQRSGGGAPTSAAQPWKGIDLTPYLGTAGVIRTVKDINSPAGGFSITFADRVVPQFADSVYALVEPMDYIEIRATRQPQNYVGQPLPLLMAGFVSVIERPESMGGDGSPDRTVTIAGQDFGKLLAINHVYWETMVATDTPYLSTFHLQAALGMDVAALPVSDFVTQLIQKVINPKIQQMSVFANAQIQPFTVNASVPDGQLYPQMWNTMDDFSFWDLIYRFADRPFNEVFSVDTQQGPQLIFRPAPYKDLTSGAFLIPGASDPGTVQVDIEEIVAMTPSRSDARVANIFVVNPGAAQLDTNASLGMAAIRAGIPVDFSYSANSPELFGVRKMTAGTNLIPANVNGPINKLAVSQQSEALQNQTQWFIQRTAQLKAMNRDNSSLEDVGFVVKGSERFVIGCNLQLTRGDLTSESYVTSVSQSIQPLTTWTTSMHTIRGTGFYTRNQSPVSPYFAENRRGPYNN